MSSGQTVALVALLIAVVGAPAAAVFGPVAADSSAPAASPAEGEPGLTGAPQPAPVVDPSDTQVAGSAVASPTNTTFTVKVQTNGDARWRITSTFNLSTDAEVESFEDVSSAFEQGETSQLGLEAFRQAAAVASRSTGRQMVLTDELRASSLPSDLPGRASLVLEFTWTNFGRSANGTVAVGDAFNTSDQWFEGLEANQRLRLRWPQGWTLVQSPPVGIHNRSLVWVGPRSFDRDDISATFASNGGGVTTDTNGTDVGEPREGLPWLPIGAVALLVTVLLGYLVLRRSEETLAGTLADESGTDDSGTAVGESELDEAAGGAAGEASTGAAAEDVDEDLLSDEERVERLLEKNGGRMKQANIVKETGWSNAKVSQLLSSMDEDDRIDKLRIGRENLISFPDEDVMEPED